MQAQLKHPSTPVQHVTRKHFRAMMHDQKAKAYATAGLNGKRAVARRQRQIAAGQLRVLPTRALLPGEADVDAWIATL